MAAWASTKVAFKHLKSRKKETRAELNVRKLVEAQEDSVRLEFHLLLFDHRLTFSKCCFFYLQQRVYRDSTAEHTSNLVAVLSRLLPGTTAFAAPVPPPEPKRAAVAAVMDGFPTEVKSIDEW